MKIRLFTVLMSLINMALGITVMVNFYGWFLIPVGAPDLSVVHLVGISMLISMITIDIRTNIIINKEIGPDKRGYATEMVIIRFIFYIIAYNAGLALNYFM